ncbi:phage tail protein [Mesorhizobium sp. BH1-1-4]|uniref:phage tail protein n=1 Tax=Mesorhizobium sp. BH1-1-4 TaxID=2876662 RepID=UPI001CD11710|nr:tail fiber protein [Mesorhizobium sp. BH1-1-4]MBZ9997833.1 tail fiber protein [Mesorhizobium sp. BH1-1-4]
MSQAFIGEIRMFAGNFPPNGWAFCQGQTLAISQNDTLFQLIGTTYGGDGQETFSLPNLAGRIPIHAGKGPVISQTYTIGEPGGVESVTVTTQQMPNHTHIWQGSSNIGTNPGPSGGVLATSSLLTPYVGISPDGIMANAAISPTGGSQPHDNMMPFLTISFIIALYGIFPSQS